MQDIRDQVVEKCGVGEVECDCEEELERLKNLAKAIELILEVMLIAVPVLAVARKILLAMRVKAAVQSGRELQQIEGLIQSAEKVASKSLADTKAAIDKMLNVPEIIIK